MSGEIQREGESHECKVVSILKQSKTSVFMLAAEGSHVTASVEDTNCHRWQSCRFSEHRIPQPYLARPASLLEVAGFSFLVHAYPNPESSFLRSAFSCSPPSEAGAPQRQRLVCVECFSTRQVIQQTVTWLGPSVSLQGPWASGLGVSRTFRMWG